MLELLQTLHNDINSIIPIDGIADNGDGTFRIDYADQDPNESQKAYIDQLIRDWPLKKAKILRIDSLDRQFQQQLNNGWTTPYGWKLGLSFQDVALLNGNFTLAKEASLLGLSNPIFIVDTNGESHELSLQDLTILMLQYGQFRASMSNDYAVKRKLIQSASLLEELDTIA